MKDDRYMWLLVFFDLPTVEKTDRQDYMRFRKFLLQDGYMMIQFSFYGRICKGNDCITKHYERLYKRKPCKGNVRIMEVTNLQYSRMKILVGNKTMNEENAIHTIIVIK